MNAVEQEARDFLDRTVPEVERLSRGISEAYWRATTGGGEEAEQEYVRLRQDLMGLFANREQFALLKSWRSSGQVQDPLLARQLDLLYNEYLGNQIPKETIAELVRRETELESTFTNFRAEYRGRRVSDNEIKEILTEENDSDLRRQAWEASKQIGGEVAPRLLELVELRNRVARDLGFRDYYAMALALQEIDEDELFIVLDRLEERTAAPFAEAKGRLDRQLAERFGVAVEALRPWHLADPFFQEPPSAPDLDLDRFFRGKDVRDMARDFYRGLGLDVDDILARSDLFEREGKNQHAYCMDLDRRGDVRILANLKDNELWASTILHELGHGVYGKYHNPELPYLLRTEAHISSTEAIAMLMGALTKNARWLQTYAGADRRDAESIQARVRDYLTLAMLVFVRWGLVMVYFERAMYGDPSQDLNRLWWDLVERLQLVRRPEGRNEPDYAAKIHLGTAPVYYQNYILGELTAAQVRATLAREAAPGSERAGRLTEPADVLIDNPRAGRFLVDRVFRLGSRYPWNELLRQATGERLNADHFVSEFVGSAGGVTGGTSAEGRS